MEKADERKIIKVLLMDYKVSRVVLAVYFHTMPTVVICGMVICLKKDFQVKTKINQNAIEVIV